MMAVGFKIGKNSFLVDWDDVLNLSKITSLSIYFSFKKFYILFEITLGKI